MRKSTHKRPTTGKKTAATATRANTPARVRGSGPCLLAAGYESVSPKHDKMRREATIETKGEDKQLPSAKRLRITNLLRDMLRNSPAFVMQNRQMCINVVGSTGGKMYASFPVGYESAAEEVMRYFNRVWAPQAEFTFGKGFNWLLKTVLTTRDVCGNVILVLTTASFPAETAPAGSVRSRAMKSRTSPISKSVFRKPGRRARDSSTTRLASSQALSFRLRNGGAARSLRTKASLRFAVIRFRRGPATGVAWGTCSGLTRGVPSLRLRLR